MHQAVHQRAGGVAGTRVNDQPGRLVDHDQRAVFVGNVEIDRFGHTPDLWCVRNANLDALATGNDVPRLPAVAINGNSAL